MGVGEAQSAVGQAIDIRCLDTYSTVALKVAKPQVVGINHDYIRTSTAGIRPSCGLLCLLRKKRTRKGSQRKKTYIHVLHSDSF